MDNQEKNYELIKFVDGDFSLDVRISVEENDIWLTQSEIAILYGRDKSIISKQIRNIIKEKDNESHPTSANFATVGREFATVQIEGKRTVMRRVKLYNLDIILEIGKHIKSSRTIKFEQWAKGIVKNILAQNNGQISQLVKFTYNNEVSLDVAVSPEEDTVWLTQNDMAKLFETTRQNISMHVKNILEDEELDHSVVKDFLITASDGKTYQTKYFNLDMIIAVGYRINSKRGTQFRRWATSVLKEYLLKGSAVNEKRCLDYTSNIVNLQNKVNSLESKLNDVEKTIFSSNNVLFFEGQIIEPYKFFRHLFFLAKEDLTIVDYYADEFLLSMLGDIKVPITIVTSNSSYLNKVTLPINVSIVSRNNIHGRYIFIDKHSYAIDNSFNSIGKKPFIAMRLEDGIKDKILN